MNIDHAKQIPIAEILSRLNARPRKTNPGKQLYSSPIRKEKTPSFWVYVKTNRWYDYGVGQGGDPVDLICAYLKYVKEDHTTSDALRWLKNMMGGINLFLNAPFDTPEEESEHILALRSTNTIRHKALVHYLHKRGIPLELAHEHLKEIHVVNNGTNKSFYALGFANEEGRYELRNPFFKGSLGPKAISFIRGREPNAKAIHLFEGFMDYLSAITHLKGKRFKGDTIVLNSLSCLRHALPYIDNYGYRSAYTWLDNDTAGKKATAALSEFFKTQSELVHIRMNHLYAPHKDVNAWLMHQRGLSL